jgi:photosystem II stability/assembly factor-like uncharacterized protein
VRHLYPLPLGFALLAACSSAPQAGSSAAPPPRARAPVLLVAAPASAEAETPAPPNPPRSPSVALAAAAPTVALTLAPAPPGGWSGTHGNSRASVTGIWGASGHVFAVGTDIILHSTDRGLHWSSTPGPRADWTAIWGASIDDIYVGGQPIVRSTDRGATWAEAAPLPGAAHAIWGSGPDDVYAVGGASGVGGGSSPFIARTTDHGRTWSVLPHDVKSGWFYDVVGTGPGEVLVSGLSRGKEHTSAVLLRSTDGGRRWTHLPVAEPRMVDNEQIRSLCFSTSGTLYASMARALYATQDWGKTWNLAADVGAEVLGLGCFGREIFVGGRDRRFLYSRDHGKTWDPREIERYWTEAAMISFQSMFVAETGETYVGSETPSWRGSGTLLRRAAR